ncbi:hypothetical protein BJ508DRAFT_328435 [Ascobolus immersus RN42]|uniref:Uncharacterized protein n=1 Tax=Ascobolus immersus RN42 TaxID=1160509 RepID=A0A3N4HZT9_ASCIM|nr:hypothetical protein BJ508DRAFT_328435 [Ascobolus immersus RN42]
MPPRPRPRPRPQTEDQTTNSLYWRPHCFIRHVALNITPLLDHHTFSNYTAWLAGIRHCIDFFELQAAFDPAIGPESIDTSTPAGQEARMRYLDAVTTGWIVLSNTLDLGFYKALGGWFDPDLGQGAMMAKIAELAGQAVMLQAMMTGQYANGHGQGGGPVQQG